MSHRVGFLTVLDDAQLSELLGEPVAELTQVLPVLRDGGLSEVETDGLTAWMETRGRRCWDGPVGLLHGDLKGENVLQDGRGGCYLIDWQRPLFGPLALEESIALLLAERPGNPENALDILVRLYIAFWYGWAFQTCLPIPFVQGVGVKYARAAFDMIASE